MKKLFLLMLLSTCLLSAQSESKGTLIVRVFGLKLKGNLKIAVFNKEDGYPTEAEKAFKKDMKKVSENTITFTFKDLPYGEYAIAIYHDENNNGKMDTNWLGIPIEGLGVSNKAKGFMGPPKYENAKIVLNKPEMKEEIKIKY